MAEWKYLYSKPFQIRYVIAAHYLKDCPSIIEIGGYKSPITDFLSHPFKQVVSVDPLIEPRREQRILHAKEDFRTFNFTPYTKDPYALVILGLDLPMDMKLYYLAAGARRLIIEFPPKHPPSKLQFDTLVESLGLNIELKVGLDLSGNDFGDLTGSSPVFPHRELYVLSSK